MSINLTLDRVRDLSLHLPVYTRPTCHIAGTNGKGSVSALLSSILLASSLSVGRFNSPHLISVHDSIVINNQPISSQIYHTAREKVQEMDRAHTCGASSFEILTMTALLIFEQAKVDIVVIEVGMGGRLDATNIIPDSSVLVSALTAVDLDHTAFLGPTVSDIAKEKAGIARTGKPFVIGEQKHGEVDHVVRAVVSGIGSHVVPAQRIWKREWDVCKDGVKPDRCSSSTETFKQPPPQPVRIAMSCFPETVDAVLPLHGDHQLANLAVATTVISMVLSNPFSPLCNRITPASVARGVRSTTWPGRLTLHSLSPSYSDTQEGHGLTVLADGAHNPSSSAALATYISHLLNSTSIPSESKRKTRCLTYILAVSHSPPKSPLDTFRPLFSFPFPLCHLHVAVVGFSAVEGMPWVKPVPSPELKNVVEELSEGVDIWCGEEGDAVEKALTWATQMQSNEGGDGLVVVAGSLYLVADFYRFLGKSQKQDGVKGI
jgi:folylpolyglutamate synthase/dihydrofolate synthase